MNTSNISALKHANVQHLHSGASLFYQAALDSVSYSTIFLAAAVGANFFIPFLTAPLAITAISIYFANTTLNLCKEMTSSAMQKVRLKVLEGVTDLENKLPYLRNAVLILGLAVSVFSLAAGIVLMVTYSFLTAVHIAIQKNREHHQFPPNHPKSFTLPAPII